jgi:hypothetical protein
MMRREARGGRQAHRSVSSDKALSSWGLCMHMRCQSSGVIFPSLMPTSRSACSNVCARTAPTSVSEGTLPSRRCGVAMVSKTKQLMMKNPEL